ncbi:right-handed parallel beta-helix repeat-containing protein [Lentiprolixibacter aurantiacus]|uniref:Right-handed parallel beta-helix repeat-containing protein n=1 Tax=Lentiprolixibacter aurantiacus TaxID=2993939 RepID=A0AAE3MLZ3_9FLAO|nr:right-handed parallel beta-helix repeat-containing protein [Lentiprolixibacter aurantiacus]MCX2719863.1 right-handed parallel beta-helix repeat-containing protein [Lentiprolixibacter aurantiacus]
MRRNTIFLALALLVIVSCSKDGDLLDAVLADEATENTDNNNNSNGEEPGSDQSNPPGEAGPPVDFEGTLAVNETPCNFSLGSLEANGTLELDCRIDLGGETVNLPSGVTLKYTGGEIINGRLNFSGGQIDGELLNKDLELTGEVTLTSEIFQLYPERWDLVQGQVDDVTARNNRDVLRSLFVYIKDLGGYRFEIDKLDAYFKVDDVLANGSPPAHALLIPSDFHLAMSEDTHIRIQPNGHFRPHLMQVYQAQNIIISGGTLHGDRETHNYNSGFVDSDGYTNTTHEFSKLLAIRGGQNILIDGLTIRESPGDGINISSEYFYYDPRHVRSMNITIRNSKIIANRRTNVVVTNGEHIYIENNEIVDGGIDMPNSLGTAPSSNLNIEPHRGRDNSGNLVEYERVSHVFIRNNIQKVNNGENNSSSAGGFQISHGNGPIIIENNQMIDSGVGFYTTDGVIIRNNSIINSGINAGSADNFDRTDFVFDNQVVGNSIVAPNSSVGINVAGNGVLVRDNNIEAITGIGLGLGGSPSFGLSNSEIVNNNVVASNRGILNMNTMKNVLVDGNTFQMAEGSNFGFSLGNRWEGNGDANFVISNNVVLGQNNATASGAPANSVGGNSMKFISNSMGDLQIEGGRDMLFEENTFDARVGANSVLFNYDAPNTTFINNEMILYVSKTPLNVQCVKFRDGVSSAAVEFQNNACVEN